MLLLFHLEKLLIFAYGSDNALLRETKDPFANVMESRFLLFMDAFSNFLEGVGEELVRLWWRKELLCAFKELKIAINLSALRHRRNLHRKDNVSLLTCRSGKKKKVSVYRNSNFIKLTKVIICQVREQSWCYSKSCSFFSYSERRIPLF